MARKPNPIPQKEIDKLQHQIKEVYGSEIINPVDCKRLADKITQTTGKYISDSTLKRFLGFHQSGFAPSYDTIKILKEFISFSEFNTNFSAEHLEKFVLDFYNPSHYVSIKRTDKGFQAACTSIALLLRKNKSLFEKVMTPLAKSSMGRSFYYELFPDYEILSDFQYKGYEAYLANEKSYEGKMFANCLLFMKHFFDGNLALMKNKWLVIKKLYKKSNPLHPFVLGRYHQTQLIGSYYFQKSETENIISAIFEIEKKLPRNEKGLFMEFPGFHYFACDGLWYIDAHEHLLKLSKIALEDYKKTVEFKWKGYYDQLYIYNSLALIKTGKIDDARKNLKHINPDRFYFITKNYFDGLYNELMESLKRS